MMNIFQRYYRDWEKDSSGFEPHKGIKDPIKARSKRLSEQLERRAKQVRKPEYAGRYEETFLKAKDKMQPPDFDTYFQAMVSSQGYLGIRPQYRAKGIK